MHTYIHPRIQAHFSACASNPSLTYTQNIALLVGAQHQHAQRTFGLESFACSLAIGFVVLAQVM